MSCYMVCWIRGFIKKIYVKEDEWGYYLEFFNSDCFYFLKCCLRIVKFSISDEKDFYVRLYGDCVVDIINSLNLFCYGLGNYLILLFGN